MKILLYDAKPYDKESFTANLKGKYKNIVVDFLEHDISPQTAGLSSGYDAVCVFVASVVDEAVIKILSKVGVKLILLRCAGFNNVDINAAHRYNLTVLRVPAYSPEAVAEHAAALALAVNRKIHKAYIKVRENNFSLVGLTGRNFYGKTAGIIGTGRIGAAMCKICGGLGMRVLANDERQNPELSFAEYTDLDTLLENSDLISLHCPLTEETRHIVNKQSIDKMKDGVILINTSRGGLINTNDLIEEIRDRKFFGVGLDVYEEENNNVFENREDDILESSITARLLSFPNVIVTSHQGFLTSEALSSIAVTTLENALKFSGNVIIEGNKV